MNLLTKPAIYIPLAIVLFFSSCSSSSSIKPDEKAKLAAQYLVCDLALRGFIQDMPYTTFYKKTLLTGCNEVEHPDVPSWFGSYYTDSECENPLPYHTKSLLKFCMDDVILSERSINYIGNPKEWKHVEKGKEPLQTSWSLSQAARIELAAYNQTKKHRPFLKKVQYRKFDDTGCALGMWIFKKDVAQTNLKPMVFIHGGAWKFRGTAASLGVGMTVPNLTELGYIVFSPFYRLAGDADGPEECRHANNNDIIDDIEYAVSWIGENGEQFGMQPLSENDGKMVIGGQSAGAHLSAYMAINHPDKIERALLLYPPADLSFFMEQIEPYCSNNCMYECDFGMAKDVLPEYCGVESLSDLTPTSQCITQSSFPEQVQSNPGNYPPMFIIQGSADTFTPIELNVRLCQALADEPLLDQLYNGCGLVRSCGGESQLRVVAGADHALDLRCLELPFIKGLPCTPGSLEGQKEVQKYLQEVYDSFLAY